MSDPRNKMQRMEALQGSEIVIGLVGAVGCDMQSFEAALTKQFKVFGYNTDVVRLSGLIERLAKQRVLKTKLKERPEFARISTRMKAGTEARGKGLSILALGAINDVMQRRDKVVGFQPRTARVLTSLKHPEEVNALRKTYGAGFFLIGIFSSRSERRKHLLGLGMSEREADSLLERDEDEPVPEGQKTRDTFHLADAFVTSANDMARVVDLLFGCPFETPSRDEHAMFLAFTTALRSADLSRQVGAVVVSKDGDVIGTGCNEVPKAGGGLYWPDKDAHRDMEKGFDSNALQKDQLFAAAAKGIAKELGGHVDVARVKKALGESDLRDITEYGRPVHAEMEALLSCARNAVSPRESTLYTTTFPCHNCAKHLIAAGVAKVVYVEPYPKSFALALHADALEDNEHDPGSRKVKLIPFTGIGPRRYFDLFSLDRGLGDPIKRKQKAAGKPPGAKADWSRDATRKLRVPMWAESYLNRELAASAQLYDVAGLETES